MIDHITIYVSDYEKSKTFYKETFAPLGYTFGSEFEMDGVKFCSFVDHSGKHDYWIVSGKVSTNVHIALRASSHDSIERFYNAALAHGGKDNGKPGPRPEYGDTYYAAFVYDPDGSNIEAMMN